MIDSIPPVQSCQISRQFREAVLNRFYQQQPSEVQLLLDESHLTYDAKLNTVIIVAPNQYLSKAIAGSRFRFGDYDAIELISEGHRAVIYREGMERKAIV
jgi:hypothetical protein